MSFCPELSSLPELSFRPELSSLLLPNAFVLLLADSLYTSSISNTNISRFPPDSSSGLSLLLSSDSVLLFSDLFPDLFCFFFYLYESDDDSGELVPYDDEDDSEEELISG